MGRSSIPGTDDGLLSWATSFSSQISATPTVFGLVAGQSTAYAATLGSYSAAKLVAENESTRTKGTVAAKNTAKANLRTASMVLAGVVRMHPGITAQQLLDLGLTVPDHNRTPANPPGLAPLVTEVSVTGRMAKYRFSDSALPNVRHKPANAIGVVIQTFLGGVNPPASTAAGWTLQGQTGRNMAVVAYPETVAPGTKCWISAAWVTRAGAYSPFSDPISTYLQIGPVSEEEEVA